MIVSAVLGHDNASPAFTVAVQHAWQEGPYEAAAALEKALGAGFSDVGNPLARDVFEPGVDRASIANQQVRSVGRQVCGSPGVWVARCVGHQGIEP